MGILPNGLGILDRDSRTTAHPPVHFRQPVIVHTDDHTPTLRLTICQQLDLDFQAYYDLRAERPALPCPGASLLSQIARSLCAVRSGGQCGT